MKTDVNECHSQHDQVRVGQRSPGTPCGTHTGLLTERLDLKRALSRSLQLMHLSFRQVESLKLIRAAIIKKSCDVAIIDIERDDIWPSLAFAEFDGVAADFPIIILCKDKHRALDYRQRAENLVDIFSYDAVRDPRFGSVIHAAKLRAETSGFIEVGHDVDRLSLSAA